jgi:hypothetical protein
MYPEIALHSVAGHMAQARKVVSGRARLWRAGIAFLALAVPVVSLVSAAFALAALASPSAADAATNPASLEPVPLRALQTAPNARYLYTTNLTEAEAAPKFGLSMTSPRFAYVFDNGKGWRLAFADEAEGLESIGYELDGPEGYALRRYTQVGAYYFGAYDPETNPRLLEASERLFGRRDPWVGVRDFSGDDPSVPQNTENWGGDWSDLEPEIGFYDDSQPATLEKQTEQAASHGLSYFAFYDYWNDQTGAPRFDDAIKAFLRRATANR